MNCICNSCKKKEICNGLRIVTEYGDEIGDQCPWDEYEPENERGRSGTDTHRPK